MRSFLKAIRVSLRYKWSIVGAIISSLAIALLWGASITTIYPFVRIVFRGETVNTWVDREIDKASVNLENVRAEIEELEKTPDANLTVKKSRLAAEEKALEWFRSIQPIVRKHSPSTPFGTLALAMGLLLVATILKGAFLVAGVVLVARVSHRTVMDMRRRFYRDSLLMDQKRIDRIGTSNLMTMLTHNMNIVSGGLTAFYGKSIREPLKMVACLVGAAFISWRLLLLSMLVVPFGAIAIHLISKRMRRATTNEMGGISAVFQTLIETFNAIKTVRIFTQESRERKRFKEESRSLYQMGMRISFFDALLRPITEIVGILVVVIAIMAGAYLVLNQQTHLLGIQISSRPLDPELLMVFFAMLAGAADPARKMGEIYYVLVRGGTACERLFETFERENNIRMPDEPIVVPEHNQSIEFRDVVFRYQRKTKVIGKLNLKINFKQSVAICGSNGSGKSSLVNLLCRFYDPNKGQVLLDGKDLSQMNPKKLRRQIAWVTQDAVLFKGTIWDNLTYAKPDATKSEVAAATEMVMVDEFISKLPLGFDTDIGDAGKKLSGGQRQKLALARAILSDPRILILDEATSQMDVRSRQMVHENLVDFIKERTTIIITHDAQSLCLAERFVFIREGRIYRDWTASEPNTDSRVIQRLLARAA